MTLPAPLAADAAQRLRDALGPRVVLAGDPGYDAVRMPWNLAIDQRPFAVASPESAEDVVDIVRAAVACGLRVAPQTTGHAAGALAESGLSDVVLVGLGGLRGATVDPVARTARVLGGSQWNDVLAVATPHGLTALHGSAGDVGVVGYTLSGGVSFYARAHGLAVNGVRSVTLVTADGALVTVDAESAPDLFWAVRGGSGAFGIVVSLEIDLLPYADVFAGMLLWDAARAVEVTRAWATWTASAPTSATTSLRIMHFPPIPELPPFLSGRSVVVIDGAILETDAEADALLAPLRALAPEIDTFGRIPAERLVAVHMDPPQPSPGTTFHAVLSALPDEAVDAFTDAAMTARPTISELRHVGGAVARGAEGGGALAALPGEYVVASIAMMPAPEAAAQARAATRAVVGALDPWRTAALALTFVDDGVGDRSGAFGESAGRLGDLKRAYDPGDVFAAAHPVVWQAESPAV